MGQIICDVRTRIAGACAARTLASCLHVKNLFMSGKPEHEFWENAWTKIFELLRAKKM